MTTKTTIGLMFAALVLHGCSTMPERIEVLENARAAIDRVERDPRSTAIAGNELEAARDQLELAEHGLEDRDDREIVRHHAYLALRHAEIAEQRVAEARVREQIEESEDRRNAILLEAREREASKAEAIADARAAEAEHAEARAELARSVAEAKAREASAANARAAAAMADARELEEELESLKARETERGMVLTLGDVLFDYDESQLKPGAEITLDRVAAFLADYPERQLLIEGHTDAHGDESYNRELSRRRAMAVRDALVRRGIAASRLDAAGLGEAYPVATNDTVAGRQQNRRVEIVISDENGQFPEGAERQVARH